VTPTTSLIVAELQSEQYWCPLSYVPGPGLSPKAEVRGVAVAVREIRDFAPRDADYGDKPKRPVASGRRWRQPLATAAHHFGMFISKVISTVI
jgi:hypothetical protein